MKMEIISEKKNPAMKRDEHIISVDHSGKATPNRPAIIKDVAKLIKVNDDLIIVDKIISNKGLQSSIAYVLSYKKKDDVPEYKLQKMKKRIAMIKKEKPAEAAPAPVEEKPTEGEEKKEEGAESEAPKQEVKTEEKKEEAPTEEKKEEPAAEEKVEEKPAETSEQTKEEKRE